ncbi:MAG: hypothetical protein E7019_07015 [Alphaproteobacteria bacterium]|nr:hypothetical protein [Alphaproteobacteria bacterium]
MIQNWLILLPEISLMLFFPVAMVVNKYRERKTSKTFFTLSKLFLICASIFTIVFYNKSVWPEFWVNNQHSTLFKELLYIVGLAWFYLSSKWFLNKNRPSFGFYMIGMAIILLLAILISARNLIIPVFFVPALCFLTKCMINQHWDENKVKKVSLMYMVFATIFCFLLWGGSLGIWYETNSLSYTFIAKYTSLPGNKSLLIYFSSLMILSSLLFMMAGAPFHFWFIDSISVSILPVCGFLTLIPPFAYLSCLIILMNIFGSISPDLQSYIQSVSLVSLVIGALSANAQTNIRRLFAYGTIYNLGFMLLGILSFKSDAIMSAFVYTLIYVMAMFGIYSVFLAIKSKGDYLSSIDDIYGMSESKPYISVAFLIFMISLIGIPPLLGFWGRLSLINVLVMEGRWWHFFMLMVALIFMANAFLRIIGKLYFETANCHFDRTDKAIYICLFINLLLVLVTILDPTYLLHDTEIIFQKGY